MLTLFDCVRRTRGFEFLRHTRPKLHQLAQDIYFIPEARKQVELVAKAKPTNDDDRKYVSVAMALVHIIAGYDALARRTGVELKHADPGCELSRRQARSDATGAPTAAASAAPTSSAEQLVAQERLDDSWATVKRFLTLSAGNTPEKQQVARRSTRIMHHMYSGDPQVRQGMLVAVQAAAATLRTGRKDGGGSDEDMRNLANEVAEDFYQGLAQNGFLTPGH